MQSKGEQTRYQYDAFGRRILKASEDQQTRFYWLGDSLIKEQHTSAALGTQSTIYLFEPEQGNSESFKPVALVKTSTQHPQGEIYHIHTDHLGTPQEVSNEAGEVIWAAQYRAYGAVKRQLEVAGSDVNGDDQPDPSFTLNLRFMGQYFDQETGLNYNRHRYYDPECGQFTTQDPIGLMGGLNNYQYVPNPVSWVDPLGLACKDCGNAGFANIYHYQGTESPHFAIQVEHQGLKTGSEQSGQLGTGTVDIPFYPDDPQDMKLLGVYKVTLPNAKAAQEFPRELLRKGQMAIERANYDPDLLDTPMYCAEKKSCLTHVFDVLNSGGKLAPHTSPPNLATARFMKTLQSESRDLGF